MPTLNDSIEVPTFHNYPTPSYQFNNPKYLFEQCVDPNDVISMMLRGNDEVQAWIPTETSNNWNEYVGHLTYAVPVGYNGSQSFIDYALDGDETVECEYAPAGMDFDICQYSVPFERFTFSTKNDVLKPGSEGGMQYCNTAPRGFVRGPFAGLQFQNDDAWVMSRMVSYAEQWMRFVLRDGSRANRNIKNGQNDGLYEIIGTVGYVDAHKIGLGGCVGEDPIIKNAASKTTAVDQLLMIHDVTWQIIQRARQMGSPLTPDDIAIKIHPMQWEYLVEYGLATGDFFTRLAVRTQWRADPDYWVRQRQAYLRDGMGFGYLPVGNLNVPILVDDLAASEETYTYLNDNDEEVTATRLVGNVQVLTRRFGGQNILAQQYVDWRLIPESNFPERMIGQNGLFRISKARHHESGCYYYNMETYWRLVSRMQRLQGHISNLATATRGNVIYESGDVQSKNYWAYEGAQAHAGTAILTPLDI